MMQPGQHPMGVLFQGVSINVDPDQPISVNIAAGPNKVWLVISNAAGIFPTPLSPEGAESIAEQLKAMAMTARTGLHLPPGAQN